MALESQRRAQAAVDAGRFDDEIVPVEIKTGKGTVEFKVDEHIRRDASLERFGKLKPAFDKNRTVTAGNASGVNDAGAAVIVMSADRAEKSDVPIRARILSYAVCGVEPKTMGIGPVPAVRKALERAGKTHQEFIGFLDQLVRAYPGDRCTSCWITPPRTPLRRSSAGSSATSACISTSPRPARRG